MTSAPALTPEYFSRLKQSLSRHLNHLVRDRNPDFAPLGHRLAQQYIQAELGRFGFVHSHRFLYRGRDHRNWQLLLPAQSSLISSRVSIENANADPHRPKTLEQATLPMVLVAAHYDTVPGSPGADDNGSGIAVLLALAQLLSQCPGRSPIKLVAFDLEEYGLVGSRAYVVDHPKATHPLKLMLSLEMLGYFDDTPHSQRYPPGLKYFYPHRGNFIGLIGNWQTIPTLRQLHRQMQGVDMPCQWLPNFNRGRWFPDTRRSDHAAFWDAGYNAILVTDTADLRNPHYHKLSDRLETLDLDRLTRVCWGLFCGLRQL